MAQPPYDLVLIVADAYRKDNAVLAPRTGYRSPFFDRLRPFYAFDRCFSSASWTLPACASILSGIDSSRHGYFSHERPLGQPTIGHYLAGSYHRTALVNNTNLREFTGFPKDFDHYQYYLKHEEPFDQARQLLAAPAGRTPRLLVFHTNISHDYYRDTSRAYYQNMFPDRDEWFPLGPKVRTWAGLAPAQRAALRSIYDASTHHMEEQLGALLNLVDLDRTILCFVADHGEGFDYERARIHHGGRLHDDLIRVPLVLRLPAGAPPEHHASLAAAQAQPCSNVDILPTLLELAGTAVPEGLSGRSLVRPAPLRESRNLVAEDRRYLYRPDRQRYNVNLKGQHMSFWSKLTNRVTQKTMLRGFNLKAYVRYPYKLILTSYCHRPYAAPLMAWFADDLFFSRDPLLHLDDLMLSLELFDLEADPGESRNLLSGIPRDALPAAIGDRLGDLSHMGVQIVGKQIDLATAVHTGTITTKN